MPTVNGAEMVALPPPLNTRIPPDRLTGETVRDPPVPAVSVTAVIPVGTFENCRLSIVNAESRVVATALSTTGASAVLKITVSAATGLLNASTNPAASVVQFAEPLPSVFQDKS